MEHVSRKSVNDRLRKYDFMAKEDDFVEVTQWVNGEGYDITIEDRKMSLTDGELDAINYLVQTLRYSDWEEW